MLDQRFGVVSSLVSVRLVEFWTGRGTLLSLWVFAMCVCIRSSIIKQFIGCRKWGYLNLVWKFPAVAKINLIRSILVCSWLPKVQIFCLVAVYRIPLDQGLRSENLPWSVNRGSVWRTKLLGNQRLSSFWANFHLKTCAKLWRMR